MRDGLSKLKQYGFGKVGKWELQKNRSGREEIKPKLDSSSKLLGERVIYAYVMGRQVKYIGICQGKNTTLKARLGSHRWRERRDVTSVKSLRDGLKKGQRITIYAWKPREERIYRWLSVDLIKGLESPLIHRFRTRENGWNKQT